ncbi:stage II sporulation protein M [Tessaracoccus sp. MC1627]|uniref:stage II sporulation protein M n=1 Tax=Tessaracoccus sp. MC1627 TaxID=2760312 RepID=UPI0016012B1C|nr:stage II sporulation protein M [Tessaracoccus sp. MC1627]MBB1512859.1 stage II sporulation protein M [Tessaracoccus sp. MC1627]
MTVAAGVSMKNSIFGSHPWVRTGLIWLSFMTITWLVAGIGYLSHPQAWQDVPAVQVDKGWDVFLFIMAHNLVLLGLIALGNVFVRFGAVTVGLLILFWQAVAIGWTAGTNGFMEPFPNFEAANKAFLFVGLWETTAYVLICAATVNKSLLVSDTFPAREWSERHSWKELRLTRSEWAMVVASVLLLLGAATVEAFIPYRDS